MRVLAIAQVTNSGKTRKGRQSQVDPKVVWEVSFLGVTYLDCLDEGSDLYEGLGFVILPN